MATATEPDQDATGTHDPQLPGSVPAQAGPWQYSYTVDGWRVEVHIGKYHISRRVHHQDGQEEKLWPPPRDRSEPDDVIWPTWPTNLDEEKATASSPLANLEQHWDATTNRLRDSAKWMAAVLGAALAAVIPTAPLAHLNKQMTGVSAVLGLLGLLSLSITMLLILRVLRPVSISYDEIEKANPPAGRWGRLDKLLLRHQWYRHMLTLESPFYRWKTIVNHHQDLYLPCGVKNLAILRQSITVEEITLRVLVRATEHHTGEVHKRLEDARAARAARLYEVRAAAASIVAMGAYYGVRARSTWATLGGAAFGLAGLILVIAAVA